MNKVRRLTRYLRLSYRIPNIPEARTKHIHYENVVVSLATLVVD